MWTCPPYYDKLPLAWMKFNLWFLAIGQTTKKSKGCTHFMTLTSVATKSNSFLALSFITTCALATLHTLVYACSHVFPCMCFTGPPVRYQWLILFPGVAVVLACQSPEGVHHKINLHVSPQRHCLVENKDSIELLLAIHYHLMPNE